MNKHNGLVTKAVHWLAATKGCHPVYAELGSPQTPEMPDAIGWHGQGSILVECKVSREDFVRDKHKSFRKNPNMGMGNERYFMMPTALYEVVKNDIPTGWGVVCVNDKGQARQVNGCKSGIFKSNLKAELYFMRNRVIQYLLLEESSRSK